LERILSDWSLIRSRARARLLGVRGAEVAAKVSIGPRCVFVRPSCINLAERVVLEQEVFLKIVAYDARLNIGAHTFLGKGVEIDCHTSIEIGEHVLLAPGSFITDHDHGIAADKRIDQQPCQTQPVIIENDVWIGANVVVLPCVHIGEEAVVGAGAVVTHNVEAMSIVAGVPARTLSSRENWAAKLTGGN